LSFLRLRGLFLPGPHGGASFPGTPRTEAFPDPTRTGVMNKMLLLCLAGACGTLARYWLSGAVYDLVGRDFPWGTAAVNILGCFFFGLVWVLSDERGLIPPQARIVILAGFMGAFTTFSTFVFETAELGRTSEWLRLGLNVAGQNLVGFAACVLGMALGRLV
jgi:CrcB protein